jgi:acyl transferase domain-containing protein
LWIGEIAAAFAAGLITAEEAIIIAYYRGYVVGKIQSEGLMMAAGFSQSDAEGEIAKAGLSDQICVACVNSPESVTVSGNASAIDTLVDSIKQRGRLARKLVTGGRAYHSHHMTAVGAEYESILRVALQKYSYPTTDVASVRFISSVTKEVITSRMDPSYWRANLERPVLFSQALEKLQQGFKSQLLEVGPHSAMKLPIFQIRKGLGLSEGAMPYFNAITRGENCMISILRLMGNMYLTGANVAFGPVNSIDHFVKPSLARGSVLPNLPPYKWTYDQPLWSECRASEEFRNRKYPRHEILGSMVPGGNGIESCWRNILRVKEIAWLEDHKLQQTVVFPGAGYIAMSMEALRRRESKEFSDSYAFEFRHVNIKTALTLSMDAAAPGVEIFTVLQPLQLSAVLKSDSWYQFEISSIVDSISTIHAVGSIRIVEGKNNASRKIFLSDSSMEANATRNWYDKLIKEGLNFGKSFPSMQKICVPRDKGTCRAASEVTIHPHNLALDEEVVSYVLHPITIDAMLQTSIIASTGGKIHSLRAKVPVTIESAVFKKPVATEVPWFIDAVAEPMGFATTTIAADLYDGKSDCCATMSGVRLAAYDASSSEGAEERHPMLRVIWKPQIFNLGADQQHAFTTYLSSYIPLSTVSLAIAQNEGMRKFLAALDVVTHKFPRLRILELANEVEDISVACCETLRTGTAFQRYSSYSLGMISEDGTVRIREIISLASISNVAALQACNAQSVYDMIVLPNVLPDPPK